MHQCRERSDKGKDKQSINIVFFLQDSHISFVLKTVNFKEIAEKNLLDQEIN